MLSAIWRGLGKICASQIGSFPKWFGVKKQKLFTLRIMGFQNWWFGDPNHPAIENRLKSLYRRVQ